MTYPIATPRRLRAAERGLAAADPLLAGLIAQHGRCGICPRPERSPYAALLSAVLYQQLATRAAETIERRFLALFPGEAVPPPAALIAIDETCLRGAGVSRQKQGYLRDIAAKALDGVIPLQAGELEALGDEAIIERLTQARGVGRWTVEMYLMFTLGRMDVLPVDDYGVRAGFSKLNGLGDVVTPRALREHGLRWAPWRSVAAWYFWRAVDAG